MTSGSPTGGAPRRPQHKNNRRPGQLPGRLFFSSGCCLHGERCYNHPEGEWILRIVIEGADAMRKAFIYWDNSNIFIEAQRLAEQMESSPNARQLVRIQFENLYELARAGRDVGNAVVAGSVPPELRNLWNRLENLGFRVILYDRELSSRGEQEVPDNYLQKQMLLDGISNIDCPGTIVLLTGDGAGYEIGNGFHVVLEKLHAIGWRVEVLSWRNSCRKDMREWVEENGLFIALDDYYHAITFVEQSRPGLEISHGRYQSELDLSDRPIS